MTCQYLNKKSLDMAHNDILLLFLCYTNIRLKFSDKKVYRFLTLSPIIT
jgi:hypothetical protein